MEAVDSEDASDERIKDFFSTQNSLSNTPSQFDAEAAHNRVASYVPRDQEDRTREILTSFLRFLPANGRQTFAGFIATLDNSGLYCLYMHLLMYLLIPMKASPMTPQPPSPLPFSKYLSESTRATLSMNVEQTLAERELVERRNICLARSNYHCMASGLVDRQSLKDEKVATGEQSKYVCDTELVHIIPFALGYCEDRENYRISQIWSILRKCFPRIGLGPEDMSDVSNLMILEAGLYRSFRNFRLAFEATGEENQYNILTLERDVVGIYLLAPDAYGNRIIQLKQYSDAAIPDPAILEMHCCLARIIHESGVGSYIDKIMSEREGIGCLANDGSSNAIVLLFGF